MLTPSANRFRLTLEPLICGLVLTVATLAPDGALVQWIEEISP